MSLWKEIRFKDGTAALETEIKFKNFLQAMAFMQDASVYINQVDHHPRWTNVYTKLHISLQTHDAGNTITTKDRDLSAFLEKLYFEKYA